MAKSSGTKVVHQDRKSALYLREVNSWTRQGDKAKNFEHVNRARRFKQQHHLTNTEIILMFSYG